MISKFVFHAAAVVFSLLMNYSNAFQVSTTFPLRSFICPFSRTYRCRTFSTILFASSEEKDEGGFDFDDALQDDEAASVVIKGSEDDSLDGSIWESIETGKPPEWMVMKELLGINGFTFILAGLIIFFLSMNFFLGPGWLGGVIGVPGTGSLNEVSDSLPDMVDLSGPEYRL